MNNDDLREIHTSMNEKGEKRKRVKRKEHEGELGGGGAVGKRIPKKTPLSCMLVLGIIVLTRLQIRMATELILARKGLVALLAGIDVSDAMDRDLMTLQIILACERLFAPLLRACKESCLAPVMSTLMSVQIEETRKGTTALGAGKLPRRCFLARFRDHVRLSLQ